MKDLYSKEIETTKKEDLLMMINAPKELISVQLEQKVQAKTLSDVHWQMAVTKYGAVSYSKT